MTAPDQAVEGRTTQQPRSPRVRHKLCYLQAVAARLGMQRVTLCGKVKTGKQTPGGQNLPPCPLCYSLVAEHLATCPACIAHRQTMDGGR